MASQTQILSVRVSEAERDLLAQAAENGRTNVSDFVRRKAIEAAELELMERRVIEIPAEAWEKFEAWAKAPPRDVPAIRKIAEMKPPWEN